MRKIAFQSIAAACCAICLMPTAKAQEGKAVHFELVATGALTLLKGKSDTYNFFSANPEIRFRYGDANSGMFLGIGTPLIKKLNGDPNVAVSTQPSSISRSDIYAVGGYAFNVASGGSESFVKVPTTFSLGIGVMNQRIDPATSRFDKGVFVYIGISAALVGSN